MRLFSLTVTWLASFFISAAVFAADIEVKMLNKGEEGKMIFEPSFIKAQVGDNIIFLPTDKGHMAASIKGLIPKGAKKFKSKINKKFSYTVEVHRILVSQRSIRRVQLRCHVPLPLDHLVGYLIRRSIF